MGEFFASIKAFLEKVNLITFLLALAVAIVVYQLLVSDWQWALFGFCISYAVFAGVHSLYNAYRLNLKAKSEEKKVREANALRMQTEKAKMQEEKEQRGAYLRTIFASLPDDVKEGLILLYKLPQPEGGFSNARIVSEGIEDLDKISNAYHQIGIFLNLESILEFKRSIKATIVTIAPDFLEVLEENANKVK